MKICSTSSQTTISSSLIPYGTGQTLFVMRNISDPKPNVPAADSFHSDPSLKL